MCILIAYTPYHWIGCAFSLVLNFPFDCLLFESYYACNNVNGDYILCICQLMLLHIRSDDIFDLCKDWKRQAFEFLIYIATPNHCCYPRWLGFVLLTAIQWLSCGYSHTWTVEPEEWCSKPVKRSVYIHDMEEMHTNSESREESLVVIL